jgi:hypothetical protein
MYTHKLVDGVRTDLTPEEIAEFEARDAAWEASANDRVLIQVRELRTQKLAESDHKMMPDAPGITDELRETWKVYRQALRDLPSVLKSANVKEMSQVVWPVAP